jgi:acyl-CoA synthetase (AMP-forming)/AMP-acid ligase II
MLGLKGWDGPCTDPEGFFHTGDLGFYDRDGIIHFIEQVIPLTFKGIVSRKFDILFLVSFESMEVSTPFFI